MSTGPATDSAAAAATAAAAAESHGPLPRAIAERLAVILTQLTGADSSMRPAISGLCVDALAALAATVSPGTSPGIFLAQLFQPGGNAAAAGTATLTGNDLDAVLRRAATAAIPTLKQLGVLAAVQGARPNPPGGPGASPVPRLPARGTGWTWDLITGSGMANLDPLPTQDEIDRIGHGKLDSSLVARWIYTHWGGEGGIPGTEPWAEVLEQWAVAKIITEALPRIAQRLEPLGLIERPSDPDTGRRVHQRLARAYLDWHPGNLVSTDWWVEAPDDWGTEVDKGGKRGTLFQYVSGQASTGNADDDDRLAVAAYGLWFAEKGFDGPKRRLRADILDLTENQVFEIKPIRGYADGVLQAWAYQAFLNAAFSCRAGMATVHRGWWIPLPVIFPISDQKQLWAAAFMFPRMGDIPGVPGVIAYLVLETEGLIENVQDLARLIQALIALEVRNAANQDQPSQQQPDLPRPESDGEDQPDSWPGDEIPDGRFPGEDEIPDAEESPPGDGQPPAGPVPDPWPDPPPPMPLPYPPGQPAVPVKSPPQPGGQASPARSVQQEVEEFLAEYGVLLVFVVLVILLAVAAVTAPAWAPVAGAAALLVLIVSVIRKLLDGSSGPPTAATAALLKAGQDSVWSDVVAILSSLPGISPDTLRSLDLATPPSAGA